MSVRFDDPDALLSRREAADFLGVSPRSLEAGGLGLPFVKVGRMVRFRLADLRAFIAAHRVAPANAVRPGASSLAAPEAAR